jgi:D-glycero-alpha-D-manno-heptose-7-phosphate kinase
MNIKAPLRIDFAGGWTDIPYLIDGRKGYVSNITISPLISLTDIDINFGVYTPGSGISTSTSINLIRKIKSEEDFLEKNSLNQIAEKLVDLENYKLKWINGRQDAYSITYGGFNCFEFLKEGVQKVDLDIKKENLEELEKRIILIYSGFSHDANRIVSQVYKNYNSRNKKYGGALSTLSRCGLEFAKYLEKGNLDRCAELMSKNWQAQKELASKISNSKINKIYSFAINNGALGGKLCGVGGGGYFIFYSKNKKNLEKELIKNFPACHSIPFKFEYRNIKEINNCL